MKVTIYLKDSLAPKKFVVKAWFTSETNKALIKSDIIAAWGSKILAFKINNK